MRSRIMVISRDAALRARLAQLLTRVGYRAEVSESAAEARRVGLDGVALAILAPDGVREENTTAVEELRAAVGRALIVAPLGVSAANPDCIDSSDEARLLARVAEALGPKPKPEATEPTLEFGGYRLDLAGHCLRDAAGKEISLRPAEFSLLRALLQRAGRVLSRDQLLQITAGRDAEAYDRSVDMQVARLRRKIEPDPKRPTIIVTVPGAGYKFAAAVHEAKLPSRPEPRPQTPPTRSDAAPRAPERRHITALAAELAPAGRGRLPSDPEDLSAMVGAFRRYASAVLTQHGGAIGESHGREILAYFGYPMAQENDAERAVRAALAIQRVLTQHNADTDAPKLSARIALDCGLVVVDSTGDVFGDAPNVAARVQTTAEPGTVLVTISVVRQVPGLFVTEELGESEPIGVPEPVTLFRVVRASGGRRRTAARALTSFVGREQELDLLARRWERAQAGEGQLVLIVGDPGMGKTRLVAEFRAKLAETSHTWVEWSALQLLQNTPLHPIAEWGRVRFGVEAPAAQRLADLENTLGLIGLDPAEYAPLLAPIVDIPLAVGRVPNMQPEELRRKQLEAIVAWSVAGARSQTVALAFEDLQWADPTSLELLQRLAERGAQARVLIIATARPEFRPPWSLRPHHSVISLRPLDRADVAQMVGELASRQRLSREVVERMSERTGGVPLFIEEVTRLLLERGEAGGLHSIPPTLQQSLAARLDRVGEAREVAQIGAVLGRDFSYAMLHALATSVSWVDEPAVHRSPTAAVDDLGLQSALDRLVDADLLSLQGAGAQAIYRFKHALIQDAAYDSLLKSRRQTLHRWAAEILSDSAARGVTEPEVIAHHFTQAGLDVEAIEWWAKAGELAERRSAFKEAASHFEKAVEVADNSAPQDVISLPQRLRLQLSLSNAVMHAKGQHSAESKAAFVRARELAALVNDPIESFSVYYGLWVGYLMRGEAGPTREIAGVMMTEAAQLSNSSLLCIAHRAQGVTHWFADGDFATAQVELERAIDFHNPSKDRELAHRFGQDIGVAAKVYLAPVLWSRGDAAASRGMINDAISAALETAHPPTIAYTHFFIAVLELMRLDAGRAKLAAEACLALAQEHGLAVWLLIAPVVHSWSIAALNRTQSAWDELRRNLSACRAKGQRTVASWVYPALASGEAEAGDFDAALRSIETAIIEQDGEHFWDSEAHRIRANIILKRDPTDSATAEASLQTAISIARRQHARSFELRAALALAKLYQSTSRPAEAHAVLVPAVKGFSVTPEMPEIAEALALMECLA
jgi:DNA-binding response OmpR family regulator/class 3 adenylate cyclase/tetratricopeptide (TPR) repeat protein